MKRLVFGQPRAVPSLLDRYMAMKWLIVGKDARVAAEASVQIAELGLNRPLPVLVLGERVRIDRWAFLEVMGMETMRIGRGTSIQQGCSLHGDLEIGEECLFSKYVFVSSGNHHYGLNPPLFIRDQDAMAETSGIDSDKVRIDDDCWIGWGVFIKRGVHIGKGAVIGAYSVVTRDVEPYTIHVGAPNRLLKRRLNFSPSSAVRAADNNCIPYFYSGFSLRIADRLSFDDLVCVVMGENATLVFGETRPTTLRLVGRLINGATSAHVVIRSNHFQPVEVTIDLVSFDFHLPCIPKEPVDHQGVPSFLRRYCVCWITTRGSDRTGTSMPGACIAIVSANLQ